MGSNGVEHLSKSLVEEGLSNQEMDADFVKIGSVDESVVEEESPDEQFDARSFEEVDGQSMPQSVLEISQSNELNANSSRGRG